MMERKKTFTMNWDALGDQDDDDDRFFESCDRLSSAVPTDLASSGSEDENEFKDTRLSFSCASTTEYRNYVATNSISSTTMSPDYDIWMVAPGSINERRKRLLQGMGLAVEKEQFRVSSKDLTRAISSKIKNDDATPVVKSDPIEDTKKEASPPPPPSPLPSPSPSPLPSSIPVVLVRSKSNSDIESFLEKVRKEEFVGNISKQCLFRTSSMINASQARVYPHQDPIKFSPKAAGKEFTINKCDQDGICDKVNDPQTDKQLTTKEFEKCDDGDSQDPKELVVKENIPKVSGDDIKIIVNSYLSKSLKLSKRRGAAFLKNIKGVAHSMSITGLRGVDKERENNSPIAESKSGAKSSSSCGWIKVKQTGKSSKELSALHLCQEIQAHEGSIWTMKFSPDTRFLASGGEDRTIHIWEVQECEILSMNEGNLTPLHPFSTPGIGEVTPMPSEKKKKKKGSANKKGSPIPEYVHASETVFSLSEKPICSFTGHNDDVLDLSWSRSQLLLSSSMDKSVRLWDMETKSCLKLFAHNDYVTCIHFNPKDENYFISGSLDNKIRMWNIPDRQLVDWIDLYEMITAVCYTPDGKGALIGSHKGNVRMYNVEDCKLSQAEQIDLQNKKNPKKITSFQFSPSNPSEVLIASADSRIRIVDGSELVYKFRGFRNLNSQIPASFSINGKYIICASEDSNVYVWKREDKAGTGKGKTMISTQSHESFQCRDVSIAIPWSGLVKGDPPTKHDHSKKNSKRSSNSQTPSSCDSPTKADESTNSKKNVSSSIDLHASEVNSTTTEDNSKKQKPPLPKRNNNNSADKAPSPEEDSSMTSQSDSGLNDSLSSFMSPSKKHSDSPSISATPPSSSSSSPSRFDGNHGTQTMQETAWGMVIVTATLGGEIRAYQNFGLPRRIGRQSNLF